MQVRSDKTTAQTRKTRGSTTSSKPQRATRAPGSSPSRSAEGGDRIELGSTPQSKKPWTVLYYGAADNNLSKYICEDVAHMEEVGSDSALNLVVQLDSGSAGSCKRYLIQKDGAGSDPEKIDSPVLSDLGQVNMSDPATLSDFIQWGMKNYPAENYILVMADHGKGWKGCCQDDSHKGWMELPALSQGLSDAEKATGKKLDIIGFDACLMASTEVAYQLRDRASYMVASQEVEGQEGWPYNLILDPSAITTLSMNAAVSPHSATPKQVAQYLVSRTSTDATIIPTVSAIDLKRMEAVAKASQELKDAILEHKVDTTSLRILREGVQKFADFHDFNDFAKAIVNSDAIQSQEVKDKAQKLSESLDSAVLAEQHSDKYPGAHGLTAELRWPRGYDKTEFAKRTGWKDLLSYLQT